MTRGEYFRTVFRSSKLKGPMVVEGWQSPLTDWHTPRLMLVVNDGGDYVEKTGLIGLLESLALARTAPPLRQLAGIRSTVTSTTRPRPTMPTS